MIICIMWFEQSLLKYCNFSQLCFFISFRDSFKFPQFQRLCENHRNSLIFYAHKISFSMIYFCCTKKVVRILIAFPGETQKKFREKLWFRYEKRDLQREKKEWWWVWQYGLWSFQMGHTKLETFLTKKQHTQRILLNSEFWINGELSKSAKIWLSKSIFYAKNHPNPSKFFMAEYSKVRNRRRRYGYQFSIFFQALRPY